MIGVIILNGGMILQKEMSKRSVEQSSIWQRSLRWCLAIEILIPLVLVSTNTMRKSRQVSHNKFRRLTRKVAYSE